MDKSATHSVKMPPATSSQRGWLHVRGHHGSSPPEVRPRRSSQRHQRGGSPGRGDLPLLLWRYDFLGDRVVHHVELSLFPNWIGGDQERLVDLRGERLTLSTRALLLRGIQQTAHLIWERVSTSEQ